VRITVADSGHGMSKETLARIMGTVFSLFIPQEQ
jgi:hypothetical protein